MFFRQLYRQWRLLFWVVLAWMTAQVFFMVKGIENAPFFLYSMFSTPHTARTSYPVVLMRSEKGYVDPFQFSNRQAELLLNNVPFYARMRLNGYADDINATIEKRFAGRVPPQKLRHIYARLSNDSLRISAYPAWWQRYFRRIASKDLNVVSLVSTSVRFTPQGFEKASEDSLIFTAKLSDR